jgi:hypothetical protein
MSVKKEVERNQDVFMMFLLQGMNFEMLSLQNSKCCPESELLTQESWCGGQVLKTIVTMKVS